MTTSAPEPAASPLAEYRRRLEARRGAAAEAGRRDRLVANLRLAVFAVGLLVAWLAFGRGVVPWGWLLLPAGAFAGLLLYHERVLESLREAEQRAAFYERGLARLEGRWAGAGTRGERFRDPAHPYAEDLDLFGAGSLFELLCTCRTRPGEEALARWLLEPATAPTIRARQGAVADLRARLDLREELSLRADEMRAEVDVEGLAGWGRTPASLHSGGARTTTAVLSGCTLVALVAWAAHQSPVPLLILVLLGQAFSLSFEGRVGQVLHGVEHFGRDLSSLSRLLQRLEAEPFAAPLLRDLSAGLETGGRLPSQQLARLETLVALHHGQHNGVFALLGRVLLWPLQVAFTVEAWRTECGAALAGWLGAAGEFEALCAVATYAYEHPDDPFPEILEGDPCFEAEGLAHPLLPVAVRNDVRLGDAVRLLIVSGSNMSGKSTLLRAVGTNVVLALAGAPVRARRLRLTPFALGASLRVQDSLQAGVSRFYAEITRLRQIVDLADGPLPLLFLLDEILHGTNSHDRRIGAEAVVRTLARKGAVGLVTTHDLALARIAEDPELSARNVHFQDTMEAGRMVFDYHLHPGVVTKSNALELMRAVGLEV